MLGSKLILADALKLSWTERCGTEEARESLDDRWAINIDPNIRSRFGKEEKSRGWCQRGAGDA